MDGDKKEVRIEGEGFYIATIRILSLTTRETQIRTQGSAPAAQASLHNSIAIPLQLTVMIEEFQYCNVGGLASVYVEPYV